MASFLQIWNQRNSYFDQPEATNPMDQKETMNYENNSFQIFIAIMLLFNSQITSNNGGRYWGFQLIRFLSENKRGSAKIGRNIIVNLGRIEGSYSISLDQQSVPLITAFLSESSLGGLFPFFISRTVPYKNINIVRS